jgi:hypothetical protein
MERLVVVVAILGSPLAARRSPLAARRSPLAARRSPLAAATPNRRPRPP